MHISNSGDIQGGVAPLFQLVRKHYVEVGLGAGHVDQFVR
jgi:hypothetical protein